MLRNRMRTTAAERSELFALDLFVAGLAIACVLAALVGAAS
jgi:hypothetical protein